MTLNDLREKIKLLVKKIYKEEFLSKQDPSGYNNIANLPELKQVLDELLTPNFIYFIKKVNWVAPKPTTFYVELKNSQGFYLIYGKRSWVAQIEGKKYYLLNQAEQEQAIELIAKILRYKEFIPSSPSDEIM